MYKRSNPMRLASGISSLLTTAHNRCGRIAALLCTNLFATIATILLSGLAATAGAQTNVSGAIAVNTQWTEANSPYLVSSDITVQNGAVLSIDGNVVIYMAADTSLNVQSGAVQALGTALRPIKVFSGKTRLNQTAAAGDWGQWVFNPGTINTKLEYVTFQHGKGISVKGSSPVFNNLTINMHQGAAISIDLTASPTGVGIQAAGNTLNGISVPAGSINGSINWGLRGIPYVVTSGIVSVGASPTINSVTPGTLQQGEAITVNLTGSRLSGLTAASFDTAELSAQVLPGGTDSKASLSVVSSQTAAIGSTGLRALVDAGEIRLANALTIQQAQPTITELSPTSLFAGQGMTDVIIKGRAFRSQTVAQVNGSAVTTQVLSSTQLTASVPNQTLAGNISVNLRTPDPINAGQYLTSNTFALPVLPAQLILSPSSTSVANGFNKSFTLSLPYAAPVGGLIVNLVSSVPSVAAVPVTVSVQQGATSATFELNAIGLGNTVITASRSGFVSGQAQVAVITPPKLTVTPSQLTLGVGRTSDITIQSSTPAPDGGLSVTLTSSDTQLVTAPASVTIPAGASSTTATVTTVAIGNATISAQASGFVSGMVDVTVRPISLNLPVGALVTPGLTRSIPLTLSDPAPEGGLVVALSSSNAANATVPTSITVPAGQSTANFTLTGVVAGSSTITATASGYQSANLPVTVATVTISLGVSSISVPVDLTSPNYSVTLSQPAPAGGVVINLATADPSKATVSPSSITIAQGQTSGGVVLANITGVAKGATTLVASAAGLNSANVNIAVTSKPVLFFSTNAITVGKGLNTYVNEVYVYRRTDGQNYSPNQAQTVNLSSSDASKAHVPATVTIPAGQYYTYFYVTGVDSTGSTPVSIDATATGYTAPATKLVVNVVNPTMTFVSLDGNRSTESGRDNFYIHLYTPGANYSSSQTAAVDLPINLSIVGDVPSGLVPGFHTAATGGSTTTQAIVKAGDTNSSSGYSYVDTPTAGGSYQVKAAIVGGNESVSAVQTVAAPDLRFSTGTVTVGKGLNSYVNEVYVYRTVNGTNLSGTNAVTVKLTSSDASKAHVPATVTIPAGQYYTYFYVTGVDSTGSTPVSIDASATGYTAPATKLVVNVVNPTMTFVSLDGNRSTESGRDNFYIRLNTPGAAYSSSQTAAVDLPINLSIVGDVPSGLVPGFHTAATGGSTTTQAIVKAGDANSSSGYSYVDTPTAGGSYQVKAAIVGGNESVSAVQTVAAPDLRFSTGTVTVGKGLNSYVNEVFVYRTVNGTNLSGTNAVTVNLTSSDASKAHVPATVTIPAGQYYTYFYVTGVDSTGSTPVSIDATATGYTAPATKLVVNVVNPTMTFVSLDGNRSTESSRDDFYIRLTTPGANYSSSQTAAVDLPINLSIVGDVPSGLVPGFHTAATGGSATTQAIVKAGYTNTTGVGYSYVDTPTATGSYQVKAAIVGSSEGVSAVQTVAAPDLRFSTSTVTVGKGLNSYAQEVYVYRTVNGTNLSGTNAVKVNLVCSSTVICNVPTSVTIPAGQYYTYFTVTGVGLGSTTITASAVGYSATQDIGVNVVIPQLKFSGPSATTVGHTSSFRVYVTTPGASYSGSQTAASAIAVNLTSSAPGVATVPLTATIPAGNTYSTYTNLTGVAVGTTTLTASGNDLSSSTSGVITINP